jgi:hypothetical protein
MIAWDIIKLANSLYIAVNALQAPGNIELYERKAHFHSLLRGKMCFIFVAFLALITFYLLNADVGVILAPDHTC